MAGEVDALSSLNELWLEKLRLAAAHKKKMFQDEADELMRVYTGPHDFMYKATDNQEQPYNAPDFKVTINKVAEAVQLYLPYLYHRNPHRQVTPRQNNIPPMLTQLVTNPMAAMQMMQQQVTPGVNQMPTQQVSPQLRMKAMLMEHYLNYTPSEMDLAEEARLSLVEGLVKGRGILWHGVYYTPSGLRIAGSVFESVDNLFWDPDAERIRDAAWMARRRRLPTWKFEQLFGPKMETKLGQEESLSNQALYNTESFSGSDRATGHSNDIIEYYEIYSRMGLGGKLSSADGLLRDADQYFPQECYIVVTDVLDCPANMPRELMDQPNAMEEFQRRTAWPTPFPDSTDPWPCTELDFHTIPRCLWPKSHMGFALGEQRFLNWAYSFLMGKIRNTCRDFVAVRKDAAEELVDTILNGRDLSLLRIKAQHPQTIQEVVQFLQHPEMKGDIFAVIQAVETNFEKRTGLSEMMFGQTETQDRSAAASRIKSAQMNVRPDYMAERVERFMSRVARKEAYIAATHLDAQDVAPVFGETVNLEQGVAGPHALAWGQLISMAPPEQIAMELDYTIEAGSTRKPNKERDIANIDESAQHVFAPLMQIYQATGDPTGPNAWLRQWAKTRDFEIEEFLLPDLRMQMMQQQQAAASQQQQQPQPFRTVG